MKNLLMIALLTVLPFIFGCEVPKELLKPSPTEESPTPPEDQGDKVVNVSFNCPKGDNFFFTCAAQSDTPASLSSGTWIVKDRNNQQVHSSTGLQMDLSLASRNETRCDPFSINFSPTFTDGFIGDAPLTQTISWPDAKECQDPPLFVDFAATNSDVADDFLIFFTNLSTKGGAPRETFSCEWSFNDPAITNGGRNEDCGFDGISHAYAAAGTIDGVRLCVTYTPTGEEQCKTHEVIVEP